MLQRSSIAFTDDSKLSTEKQPQLIDLAMGIGQIYQYRYWPIGMFGIRHASLISKYYYYHCYCPRVLFLFVWVRFGLVWL